MTREALLALTKEQLVELLEMALEAQKVSTQNQQGLTDLLQAANAQLMELKDKVASQEAEIIMLRTRP